ncbi:MAG: isoamylase early set domain-containing protein [Ilumatobacteraceae bacterium]
MIVCRARADGLVEITFRLPVDHPAAPVGVAGTFNGWEWQATPLVADGDHLVASTVVTTGGRYEFRYRTADGRWFNDESADDYVPNEFGGVNCVVDLTASTDGHGPGSVDGAGNGGSGY